MRFRHILPLAIAAVILMAAAIDLNNLENYANQLKPLYIVKNNTPPFNQINNRGATLGRVLFYDKNLSANNTIACGSCHMQQFAFGDTARLSKGLNGEPTGRHAMRLVNARFGNEVRFFWDERAPSLEIQTTRPIKDHIEMGFSGDDGDPDLDSLVRKIQGIDYYKTLFEFVYGDTVITEIRMQFALAQFVRSIQSFDSKFDEGFAQTLNLNAPFPNFTQQENLGKALFLTPPGAPQPGAGCQGCHRAPEFDIDPGSRNNGVITAAADPNVLDLNNTRAPSLRDLFNPSGELNGPLMHNGNFETMLEVINHYNLLPPNPANTNLDPRLAGPPQGGQGQNLNLTQGGKDAIVAFLKTLSGNTVYTDPKWSDPFLPDGNLDWTPLSTGINEPAFVGLRLYPNPATDVLNLELENGDYSARVFDQQGKMVLSQYLSGNDQWQVSNLQAGTYMLHLFDRENRTETTRKFLVVR